MTYSYTDKEIFLFGAGSLGMKVLEKLKEHQYNVIGIYDNDPNKENTYIEGIQVSKPEGIQLLDNQLIVIASTYSVEIQTQLRKQGVEYGLGYINYNELFPYIEDGLPMKFSRTVEELSFIGEVWKYSIDEMGVLIKQDNRVLRAIYKHNEALEERLLDTLNANDFYQNRIITAKVSEYQTANFPLILEHPLLSFCSDSRSWSFTMKTQAMNFIVDLIKDLRQEGLTLKDGHVFNLTYVNNTFCWIDFGSIKHGDFGVPALKEWMRSFVFPLVLMRNLKSEEYRPQVLQESTPYFMVLPFLDAEGSQIMDHIFNVDSASQDAYDLLLKVQTWINSYLNETSIYEETDWDSYRPLDTDMSNQRKKDEFANKHEVIKSFLSRTQGKTLIDIAGNNGFYCVEAYQNYGYSGVLTDYDYQCINNAYLYFQKEDIHFTPVVNDFNYFPQNLSFMGDNKFDVTLCLAFIHHLIFSNGFTLERVRDTLANVTNQHLIIEFVDRSDEYVSQWINPFFDWYNQSNFEHIFEQRFIIEDKQKISDSRTVYFMKLNSKEAE